MSDWDLDLRDAEEQMDEAFAAAGDVVLGVLDGTTDPDEWVRSIDYGNTLVLSVDGDSTNSPRVRTRGQGYGRRADAFPRLPRHAARRHHRHRPTERVGPHPPSEITATALPPGF